MTSTLRKQTLSNAVFLTAGQFAEAVLQFVFIVLASREMGPAEFGYYGYIIAIFTFILVFAQWGQPVIMVREMAQHPEEESRLFASMFRIRGGLSLTFFAIGIIAGFMEPDPLRRSAVWFVVAYLLFLPFDLYPVFDVHKLSRWDVPGKLGGRFASVVTLFLLWKIRGHLTITDVAMCASLLMFVNAVIGWIIARRLGFSLHPFGPAAKTGWLFRTSRDIVWQALMPSVFQFSQPAFVKWFSTETETGYYSLAARLFLPALLIKGVVARLMLPLMSDVGRDPNATRYRLEQVLPPLFLLFTVVAAAGIQLVDVIIVPVFGIQYQAAILPTQIAFSHLFITGAGFIFTTVLVASGNPRSATVALTIGCVASVVSSILLIPRLGAIGAAWSAWLGEVFVVIYTFASLFRRCPFRIGFRIPRIIAVSVLSTVLYFVLTRVFSFDSIVSLLFAWAALTMGLVLAGELNRSRVQAAYDLIRKTAG